jgi:hypothetical protein
MLLERLNKVNEIDKTKITKKYLDIINKVVAGYGIDESQMNVIITDIIFSLKTGPVAPPVTHKFAPVTIPIINFIYDYEKIPCLGVFQNVDEVAKTKELLEKDGIITESENLGVVSAELLYKDVNVYSRFTDITSYNKYSKYKYSKLFQNGFLIRQKAKEPTFIM